MTKSYKIKNVSLPRPEQYWHSHDADAVHVIKLYWTDSEKGKEQVGSHVKFHFS